MGKCAESSHSIGKPPITRKAKFQLLDGSIIEAYPKRVKETPKPAEPLTEESKGKEKAKDRRRWHIETKRARIRAHIEAHRIRT